MRISLTPRAVNSLSISMLLILKCNLRHTQNKIENPGFYEGQLRSTGGHFGHRTRPPMSINDPHRSTRRTSASSVAAPAPAPAALARSAAFRKVSRDLKHTQRSLNSPHDDLSNRQHRLTSPLVVLAAGVEQWQATSDRAPSSGGGGGGARRKQQGTSRKAVVARGSPSIALLGGSKDRAARLTRLSMSVPAATDDELSSNSTHDDELPSSSTLSPIKSSGALERTVQVRACSI